jgi:transcriptional regulator with XRE-family HTH domain
VTAPREPRAQRVRLGSELRQLRRLAGLSGEQMARQVGVSQRTVSRFENGQALPSIPQVTAWARVAKAGAERRELLVALAEAAVNEVAVFRDGMAGGLAGVQVSFRELEASAGAVRNFQPGLVPGLLQTAEYARRVLEIGDVRGTGDAQAAAVVRLQRQQALHQPGRVFEFVITEAALRWRPGPAEIMSAQLLHIAALAGLESVRIGVIPADTEMHAIVRCGFILYDDRDDDQAPVVSIETPHAALYVSEPADVDIYRGELARFRQSAVFGAAAAAIIRELATATARSNGQA